jgi:hypothetical protein
MYNDRKEQSGKILSQAKVLIGIKITDQSNGWKRRSTSSPRPNFFFQYRKSKNNLHIVAFCQHQ